MNSGCLYLLNSPIEVSHWNRLREIMGPDDALVLIEDATYLLTSHQLDVDCFYLVNDCRMRGITPPEGEHIALKEYESLVDLTLNFAKNTTWTV